MTYMDNCTACEDKARDLEHAHVQLDEIRKTVDDYYQNRDHWDWDNLIDDIMAVLEK